MKNSDKRFLDRIKALRVFMVSTALDLLIIENPIDLYYLTGLRLSKGRLLVHRKKIVLAVDGRYEAVAKKESPYPVIPLSDKECLALLTRPFWKEANQFGFDSHALSYYDYLGWRRLLDKVQKVRRLKKKLKLKGVEAPILSLRKNKDRMEITRIKKSAKLLFEGFLHIKQNLCEGISEHEVAISFETYCKQHGAEALSFTPIIAFGANSAFPHYVTGRRRLKKGDIVLIDIGVVVDHYASDMTRMLFFGPVSKKLEHLFTVVKEAHSAALTLCKPGNKGSDLDRAARRVMAKEGLEEKYLHSLGHGIGLEVHEPPSLGIHCKDVVLEPGMVVSIEPGLYLPGYGGVRYEDMVIITPKGYQNLFPETSPYEGLDLLSK